MVFYFYILKKQSSLKHLLYCKNVVSSPIIPLFFRRHGIICTFSSAVCFSDMFRNVITLSVMTVPFVMFCYKITFKTSRNTTPAVPPRELMPSVHQLTASVTPVSVPSTLTANSAATPCKTLINSALSTWPERSIAPRITSAAAIPAT